MAHDAWPSPIERCGSSHHAPITPAPDLDRQRIGHRRYLRGLIHEEEAAAAPVDANPGDTLRVTCTATMPPGAGSYPS